MFERILNQLRERIRTRQYVMTIHADEEMDNDGLTIFDVESAVLSGRIIERQKGQQSGEWKYLVKGEALNGESVVTVTKIGPTGKLIFITVYRD
ncbi:MAG: DUF4258 domain-containing protein [Anaerolineales bacterium]|nr:DUF4258 domain-containing protein [Anaerolineales bacterium]